MEIRKNLIIDISAFLEESIEFYKVEKKIDKFQYLNLELKICSLRQNDFESEEKYSYFLSYINQSELLDKRNSLENLFRKKTSNDPFFVYEDGNLLFLLIDRYLRTLLDWLK